MCSSGTIDLSRVVDALAETDIDELCVSELQELIAAVAPQLDRLSGVLTGAVGALQVRTGGIVPSAPGVDGQPGPVVAVRRWLRDTTGCGPSAAGTTVQVGVDLRALPLVAQAVRMGRVGAEQARVLTRLVGRIPAADLLESQPALIEVAAGRDPQALAVWVRHLIATWCEPAHDADDRSAHNKRYVQTRRNGDGTIRGSFLLTDEDAESLFTVLEPLARPAGLNDGRSAGQRRADPLVEVFNLALRHADLPDAGGARPHLSYVVPAGWAAAQPPPAFTDLVSASLPNIDGAGGSAVPPEAGCATAAWTGPQTRARIEAMLCEARISRVLLDAAGQVQSLQAFTDSITAAQRRALTARDRSCVARGCTRPPAFCDAHHLTHREDGGATTLDNLVLLCRRHHMLWHQGRLQLHELHVPWLTTTPISGTGPPRE